MRDATSKFGVWDSVDVWATSICLICTVKMRRQCFEGLHDFGKKLDRFLANPEQLNKIGKNGLRRVWQDGHDIETRMKFLISKLKMKKWKMMILRILSEAVNSCFEVKGAEDQNSSDGAQIKLNLGCGLAVQEPG